MKAIGKLKKERGLTLYDAPLPYISAREVLIKVKKTAICGTDLHIYKWDEWAQQTIPVPMTVGHEFMGVIEKVGAEVKGFKPGDRVSGEGHLICGVCRNCREGDQHHCRNTLGVGVNRTGCFAQYLSMPVENLVLIPSDIPDEIAAFLDPLGNAVHTALSFDLVGKDVLITGAGPIGIMAVAIAKKAGAHRVVITDVNEYRLELAKKCGATRTVNVAKETLKNVMEELKMKEGFEVGLEMSGVPSAFEAMIDCMNHGGKIALLGILPKGVGINWIEVIFKSLTIKGIYGREMYTTWHTMLSMLQSGLNVRPVLTHEFPAEEFEKAFELMLKGETGKVILNWE